MKLPLGLAILLACAVAAPAVHASDASSGSPGVRVFIEHQVADYAAWRKAYDAFAPTQKKMGVTHAAVYQSVDDPNDVVVTHDFATAEKAKAFLASDELKAAMQKAGVKGPPHITITTRANK